MKSYQKPIHPSKAGKVPRRVQEPRHEVRESDMDQGSHRTLPHSLEAEQGVLCSMLLSPQEAIGACIEFMGPRGHEWFYAPAHQTIYIVLVELWRAHTVFDLIIFTQILRDRNILATVGGASAVTSLYTFVPTASNLEYYVAILRDKFVLREIIAQGTEQVQRAFEEQDEVESLLAEIETKVLSIRPPEQSRDRSIKDATMDAMEALEKLYETKGAITGIATGFAEVDRLTSGLQPQDMIIIAARPSMGKTAMAMNIADHVAVNLQLPVAVFSLEMSEQQLMQRLLCARARVNLQKLRDGFLSERDFPALSSAATKLIESQLHINDEKLYVDVLAAKARRMKKDFDIKLIIVDYLQLLRARGFKVDNRQAEVSYISGTLKGLAKALSVPVLVLAQLNRNPEGRSGGKPRLSDLRESGSLEQDADVVGLLVRGEVYEDDTEVRAEKAGEAELIIAKQRNGPIGECYLTFLKEFTKFEDRARNIQGEL